MPLHHYETHPQIQTKAVLRFSLSPDPPGPTLGRSHSAHPLPHPPKPKTSKADKYCRIKRKCVMLLVPGV